MSSTWEEDAKYRQTKRIEKVSELLIKFIEDSPAKFQDAFKHYTENEKLIRKLLNEQKENKKP